MEIAVWVSCSAELRYTTEWTQFIDGRRLGGIRTTDEIGFDRQLPRTQLFRERWRNQPTLLLQLLRRSETDTSRPEVCANLSVPKSSWILNSHCFVLGGLYLCEKFLLVLVTDLFWPCCRVCCVGFGNSTRFHSMNYTRWVIITGPPSAKCQNFVTNGPIFIIFFTVKFRKDLRRKLELKLSPALKSVAALPCET